MTALDIGIVSLAMMVVLIIAGLHVAISLLLLSFVGVWLMRDNIDVALALMAQATSDSIASHEFGVVPLFVLMGLLVATMPTWARTFSRSPTMLRRIRGGLGVATVAANAVFAAITGISIASAAVFTKVAVPEMLRFGFTPRFATGVVAGSSVLGMLIPPSLLMILYALPVQAVGRRHVHSPASCPACLLALAFSLADRADGPPGVSGLRRRPPRQQGRAADAWPLARCCRKVLPVVLLIFVRAGRHLRRNVHRDRGRRGGRGGRWPCSRWRRKLTPSIFWKVLTETGRITVSVLFLIIAANLYSRMLTLSRHCRRPSSNGWPG
jgi:TRAP-type C4-dicarboxylate transport system permease large subunit